MKIKAKFEGATQLLEVTLNKTDFPKRELIQHLDAYHIPADYKGIADDPYFVEAFNAALRTGRTEILYVHSIVCTEKWDRPDLRTVLSRRFLIGSAVLGNYHAQPIFMEAQNHGLKANDFQFYCWMITDILEQELLKQNLQTRKDKNGKIIPSPDFLFCSVEGDSQKYYYNFVAGALEDGVLPDQAALRKYRALVTALSWHTRNTRYANMEDYFGEKYHTLYPLSQKFTEEEIIEFYNLLAGAIDQEKSHYSSPLATHENAIALAENWIQDKAQWSELLKNSPKNWLNKLFA